MTAFAPLDQAFAPLDRTTPPWPGAHIRCGGTELFVRTTEGCTADLGDLPPDVAQVAGSRVVYVHGLGGSSLNFSDVGEILHPVLPGEAVDLPGFGFSPPPKEYSLRSLMTAVIDYLDHTGPAHVVGNSLGGVVVARVAQERPDLVKTLTLISPAFPDMRPRMRRLSFIPLTLAKVPVAGPAVFGYLGRHHAKLQVRQTLREIMYRPERLGRVRTDQAVEHAVDRAALPWAPDALSSSLGTLVASWAWKGGRDHWTRARHIAVPTLVIWGSRDLLVSAEIAPKLVRMIPGSRLVMFNDVGHVSQMEAPVDTAREILAHITKYPDNWAQRPDVTTVGGGSAAVH